MRVSTVQLVLHYGYFVEISVLRIIWDFEEFEDVKTVQLDDLVDYVCEETPSISNK